jgi:hypothetical protein
MKKKVVALGLAALMIISIFFMNNTKVSASKLDKGAVSYSTSTSTVLIGNGFYSASASLTPSPSTVDIGVDPSTIQKVVIEDANGFEIALLTQSRGSVYNLPSLSGQVISVVAGNQTSYNGYFRWLRNAKSNVWSFDSDDGVTHRSTDAAPPNDSYGYNTIPSQSYVWSNYHIITHPSGFNVNGGIVPFSAVTNVTLKNAIFVQGAESTLQLETGNNPSFVNGHDAKISFTEIFDYVPTRPEMKGNYADPTAIWYQYNNGVQVDYEATTYYYPSNWRIVAYINAPAPTPSSITGDFTIQPSATIAWRDSFTLHPLPFSLSAGCSYQDHYYKIERNGSSVTTPKVYNATQNTSFSYGSYPSVLAVGSNNISLMIEASCGNSGWISTHTLNVTGPASNNPPDFILGWVYPGTKTPVTQVVQGAILDLIYIDDPSVPTPKDPEGDPIYFDGFNFSSSDAWTKTIPTKSGVGQYIDGYHNITMDGLGNHSASASFHDIFGASATKSTSVYVIPPNPVPVCTAPIFVKENRTIAVGAINADSSYSPLNRTIDHTKDVWVNKLSSYTNGTSSDITVQAILQKITDSAGLDSLYSSSCNIIVHPDLPPVGGLAVPPIGIRGQSYDIFNQFTSPDGDTIASIQYKYKYDANNNGFSDESWTSLAGNLTKAIFTPNKVGKYLFFAEACEDFGKCGDTSTQSQVTLTLDITNLAPEVSFKVEGNNPQPDPNPPTLFTADVMINNWNLYQVNKNSPESKAYWYKDSSGMLSVGLGKRPEFQRSWLYSFCPNPGYPCYNYSGIIPFSDNGNGNNRISSYRAMQYVERNTPILIPMKVNGNYTSRWTNVNDPYDKLEPAYFSTPLQSTKKHILFKQTNTCYSNCPPPDEYLYAWNKDKTPRYTTEYVYANNSTSLNHKWLDPQPYDYVLAPEPINYSLYSIPVVDASRNPTGQYVSIRETYNGSKFYYAGSTIIGTSTYNHPTTARYYESCHTNSSGDESCSTAVAYEKSYNVYRFNAYAESTGSKGISFSLSPTTDWFRTAYAPLAMSVENGTIIFTSKAFTVSDYTQPYNSTCGCYPTVTGNATTWEYDLNGNLIRQYEPSATFDPNAVKTETVVVSPRWQDWSTGQIRTGSPNIYYCMPAYMGDVSYDDEGNSYTYLRKNCSTSGDGSAQLNAINNPESPAGMWLVKKDKKGNVVWQSNLTGDSSWASPMYYQFNMNSGKYLMAINPVSRQIITQSFNTYTPSGSYYPLANTYHDIVNMDTGASYPSGFGMSADSKDPSINPNNGAFENSSCSYTIEGNCSANTTPSGGNIRMSSNPWVYDLDYTGKWVYGEYFGDGVQLNMFEVNNSYSAPGYSNNGPKYGGIMSLWVSKGPPTTTPEVRKGFKLGQFISDQSFDDSEITFNLKIDDLTVDTDKLMGMSFRMEDAENRYAVETNGTTLYLSKYVGSVRTVLSQLPWTFVSKTSYDFKIRTLGTKIELSLNKAPVFSVVDAQFASGKLGAFTQKSFVSFGALLVKKVKEVSVFVNGYAIWDQGLASAAIRYTDILFTDPENDPISNTYQWTYTHIPKFINNQGVSALIGQTFSSGQLQFDKVGEYTVSMSAKDDPYPNIAFKYPSMVFDAYRKLSNTFQSKMIVHRRPIADFSLSTDASGVIIWTDTSYDPDRYDRSTGTYSTESTGINYHATRGVLDWKYYYLTPSGTTVNAKLTRPQEKGTYLVGMQVKDEYGAWSEYTTQSFTSVILAPPNEPPVAVVTNPNGVFASPTVFNTLRPTIAWSQTDPDIGATFKQYQVQVSNELGNTVYLDSGVQSQNTTSTSANWTVNVDLPANEKLQVRVRVSDGLDWSNWSAQTWMMINRAPTATMTVPGGTQAVPTIFNSLRPTMQWSQTDSDTGTIFKAFQIQITNEANNVMILDSGQIPQNTSSAAGSLTVTGDLPAGQKLRVWVRVHDGYVWSSYSPQTWMYINRAPTADFDWSPKPVYEGDTASFVNLSTDPDGDSLTYSWIVRRPDNSTFGTVQNQFSNLLSIAGNYEVTLDVSDGKARASITKIVTVLPLTIQSDVTSTQQWLEHHQIRGHQTSLRPRDFYSGEIFIVETRSASAPVEGAKAWMDTTGLAGNDIFISEILQSTTDPNLFQGELFDPVLQSMTDGLPEGLQTIHFEIRYTNGIVKTEDIPVNIIGNVNQSFGVHRVR